MNKNLLNLIVVFLTFFGWSQSSSKTDFIFSTNKISTIANFKQQQKEPNSNKKLCSDSINHVSNYTTNVMGTFDGLDDFVKIDSNPALDLTNNYTFEAWVNQEESTGFGGIIDKGSVQLFIHNKINLTSYNENSLVLSIATANGIYVINTKKNSIKQNSWHHIVYRVSTTNIYKIKFQ